MEKLIETRKADRKRMAQIVYDLAIECGAQATIIPEDPACDFYPRNTRVSIEAARGVCLTVGFNGNTPQLQPNTFVLSWHMSLETDAAFADAFGDINRHHFHKATDIADGMTALCAILRRRLGQIADGSAFSAEREAAGVAKNGTWQDRRDRFARWRAEEAAERAARENAA